MSDIRAQSRRDAEFERLADEIIRDLGGMSEAEIYDSFRKLHEMGKRHGREEMQNAGYRLRTSRCYDDEVTR